MWPEEPLVQFGFEPSVEMFIWVYSWCCRSAVFADMSVLASWLKLLWRLGDVSLRAEAVLHRETLPIRKSSLLPAVSRYLVFSRDYLSVKTFVTTCLLGSKGRVVYEHE